MYQAEPIRTLTCMKRRLLLMLLVTGLLVLALAGWSVKGVRWIAGGGRADALPQPA